jgi:hypothetical protein
MNQAKNEFYRLLNKAVFCEGSEQTQPYFLCEVSEQTQPHKAYDVFQLEKEKDAPESAS